MVDLVAVWITIVTIRSFVLKIRLLNLNFWRRKPAWVLFFHIFLTRLFPIWLFAIIFWSARIFLGSVWLLSNIYACRFTTSIWILIIRIILKKHRLVEMTDVLLISIDRKLLCMCIDVVLLLLAFLIVYGL
jgi:hypothetical protein